MNMYKMMANAALFIILISVLGVWSRVPKWHRSFERRFNDLERKVLDESVEFRDELLSLLDKVEEITVGADNAPHTEFSATNIPYDNDRTATCGEKTEAISEALAAGFGAEKEYVRRMLLKFEELVENSQTILSSVTGSLEIRLRDQIEATKRELESDMVTYGQLIPEVKKMELNYLRKIDNVEEGLKKEIVNIKERVENELQLEIADLRSYTEAAIDSYARETQAVKHNVKNMELEMGLVKKELLKDLRHEIWLAQMKCGSWLPFMDSCYNFISTEKITWQAARDKCLGMGGYLAEVDSAEEDDFLRTMAHKHNTYDGPWLGASGLDEEGLWRWSHSNRNVKSVYNGFSSPEPNEGRDENCLHLLRNGENYWWNDTLCSISRTYICEK